MRNRSFDVFDTVLTRRVGAPPAVFTMLAERLRAQGRLPCSPAAFVDARIRSERELQRWLGRPVRLAEVYESLARRLSLPAGAHEKLMCEEMQLEREISVLVPGAQAVLAEARADRSPVLFVSDTPHPDWFLAELLDQAGVLQAGDRVYGSADWSASKSRGDLFAVVAGDVGAPPGSFLHCGDNRRSDVASARLAGWRSYQRPHGALNRYERLVESGAGNLGVLASVVAGSSRIARLEGTAAGLDKERASVAAGVLAPTLIGYTLWLAAQARLRGIQRLYFVARDGQIMHAVAQQVLAKVAPDLELRYLYGSRQAWNFAASAHSDQLLRRWVSAKSDFTLRTTLARVGLAPEEVWATTRRPFTHPDRADEPLTRQQRAELAELVTSEPLKAGVRRGARDAFALARDYLAQEGLDADTPSALVDAGWAGTTAQALDRLLLEAGLPAVTHLFVGLLRTPQSPAETPANLRAWLFDESRQPGVLTELPGANMLIEMFCAGTHGRLLGYARDGERVRPVLASERNQPVLDWGIRDVQRVAVRVAELAADYVDPTDLHADWTPTAWELLRKFWSAPTRAEVSTWASFPWEEETWPPFQPIAQTLTTGDVLRRLLRGERSIRRHTSWRAGTARASGQPWRALLRARAWQQVHEPRMRRLPRRVQLEIAQRAKATGN